MPAASPEAQPVASSNASRAKPSDSEPRAVNPYPFYSPRFWHGMRPGTWWRLLRRLRFAVPPSRWGLVIAVSIATPFNSLLAVVQRLIFGRQLDQQELSGPPIFIVGHWRSGTTLLHELLSLDDRYGSPSTYQCFAPHHFLISQWFFRRFASWLLPGRRPMDNMAAGWDRPQEDEFALMNLGLPSPYRRIAIPADPQIDIEYLDLQLVDSADRQRWFAGLSQFLTAVTYTVQKPLVIKSPTHTGRIGALADAFPDAKFIHITRDPMVLFPSTVRLWRSLDDVQSVGKPQPELIPEYVMECFERMYAAFERDRPSIPDDRLVEIRYEDLVAEPIKTLDEVYGALMLDGFEQLGPKLDRWVETEHRQYQPNRHQLDQSTEQQIRQRWSGYIERYGYARTDAP